MGEPSPHSTTVSPASRAAIILRIIAGITWLRLEIEVVARTVEVHRQQEDAVEPVLLAVRLALHEHHLLGEPVGRVGLLG